MPSDWAPRHEIPFENTLWKAPKRHFAGVRRHILRCPLTYPFGIRLKLMETPPNAIETVWTILKIRFEQISSIPKTNERSTIHLFLMKHIFLTQNFLSCFVIAFKRFYVRFTPRWTTFFLNWIGQFHRIRYNLQCTLWYKMITITNKRMK